MHKGRQAGRHSATRRGADVVEASAQPHSGRGTDRLAGGNLGTREARDDIQMR